MKKKILIILFLLILVVFLAVYFGNGILIRIENNELSKSIDKTNEGSLINGKRIPSNGNNFVAYSYLGTLLGRNCVHSTVRDIVLETYGEMYRRYPDKTFVYGETGWCGGGRIRPHKTHRNGLSVDFVVPVLNEESRSVPLPASVLNKFGYSHEFDNTGKLDEYSIDFEAMAAHLFHLQEAATRHAVDIEVVIFDPNLQPMLFRGEYGQRIKESMRFSTKPSWVRHDEHYHIDFVLR